MQTSAATLVALEKKLWQSTVDQDARTATSMLIEPAWLVSAHGATKSDQATCRKMVDQGPTVLKSFAPGDVDVTSPTGSTVIVTYRVKQGIAPCGGKGWPVTQEMNDSSTWVRAGNAWKCAMRTETEAQAKQTEDV